MENGLIAMIQLDGMVQVLKLIYKGSSLSLSPALHKPSAVFCKPTTTTIAQDDSYFWRFDRR